MISTFVGMVNQCHLEKLGLDLLELSLNVAIGIEVTNVIRKYHE